MLSCLRILSHALQRTFCEAFDSPKLNARQHAGMMAFFDLLESEPLVSFLQKNPCFDRYYIASVYVYFQRANLHAREYNPRKFAMALHIANAMKVDSFDCNLTFDLCLQEDDCSRNDPLIEAIYTFSKSVGFPSKAAFFV